MSHVRIVDDPVECRQLWECVMPAELVTDDWSFRACFEAQYRRPSCFIVAEDGARICGLLPLSWIEEADCYGYFPGETWHGKTWLEQNRLIARNRHVLRAMLEACPGPYHLRYLLPDDAATDPTVDEIGYLFSPPKYGYDMNNYFQEFSSKSSRRIRREIDDLIQRGGNVCHGDASDFDLMVDLNVQRYGGDSYFADGRFRESCRLLMRLLRDRRWLRVTTVALDGEVAAVDMGCVHRGVYSLLAGGASPRFAGVAKLINVHHMEYACRQRLQLVDFLCGNFSWKTQFHLTPRTLHLLSDLTPSSRLSEPALESAAHG